MIDKSEGLRRYWYPVAEGTNIANEPLPVTLLGERLVLWRSPDGEVVAAPDRCPHREAPLSIGSVVKGKLFCAYHGWGFADSGKCVAIPSSGEGAAIAPAAHLRCVRTAERYGLVWVLLDDSAEEAAQIPHIGHDDDPTFRRINTGVDVWKVAAPRMVDNFLDISHFPFVHTGTFGGAQPPNVPKLDLQQLDADFYGYAYEVEAKNPDAAVATSGSTDSVVHRYMTTGFALPLIVRSTIRYDDGLEHILLLCSTPIDDSSTYFTFVVWRNDDFSVDPEEIISFDRAIGAEDKAMLEQVPGALALGQTDLVSVQSDKPSVEWRRRFAQII